MEQEEKSRIRSLREKFYSGTISKEEKNELFNHYRHLCSRTAVREQIIRNFLLFTRPKSGRQFTD